MGSDNSMSIVEEEKQKVVFGPKLAGLDDDR